MLDKTLENALRRKILSIFIFSSAIQLMALVSFNLFHLLMGGASSVIYIVSCLISLILLGAAWWLNQICRTRWSALAYLLLTAEGALLFAPLQSLDQTLLFFALGTFAASYVFAPFASFLFVLLAGTSYTIAYWLADLPTNDSFVSLVSLLVLAFAAWLSARVFLHAREQLRQSLEQQQARFEHLSVGWYQTDRQGQILAVNPRLVRMLGYPNERALLPGNIATVYVDQRARQEWHLKLDAGAGTADVQWRKYDGATLWVHESARAVRGEHGQVVGYAGTVEDVAARKQTEDEQQRRGQVMAMLYGTTRDLVANQKVSSLIQTLAQRAVVLVGHGRSRIYLYDLDGKHLDWVGSTDSTASVSAAPLLQDQEMIQQAIQTRAAVFQDSSTLQLSAERDDAPSGATAAIPMFHNTRLFGVIVIEHADPMHRFADQEIRALGLFAKHAAAAVDNAQQLERASQGTEILTHLSRVAAVRQDGLDVRRYLRAVCKEFQGLGKFALAFLKEPETGLTHIHTAMSQTMWNEYHAAFGEKQLCIQVSMPAMDSTWKQLQSGQAISDPEFLQHLTAAAQNGSGAIAEWLLPYAGRCTTWLLPLGASETPVGLLALVSESANLSLAPAFSLAAQSISNRLESMRLANAVKQSTAELEMFRDTGALIDNSKDLHALSEAVLEQIVTHLKVDAADVLTLDPEDHSLKFVAGQGFRTHSIERTHLRIGEGLAGRAARKRQMVLICDSNKEKNRFAHSALFESEGFVGYIGAPLLAEGQVKGVIEIFHRAPLALNSDSERFLFQVMNRFAAAIEDTRVFLRTQQQYNQLVAAYDSTLATFSHLMELRDHEPMGHTRRVTELAVHLARAMGLEEDALVEVRRGALLHDIGKIGIPDAILLSSNPLTSEEWAIVRAHPQMAYDMLSPIAYLKDALAIPYNHHERWDGSGYPRGLRGEQIPLAARIFAAVDLWDALTSDRPYRAAWDAQRARDYIDSLSGTQLDPQVVQAFLQIMADEPHVGTTSGIVHELLSVPR